MRAYIYLVLTSQLHARSSVVGNSACVVNAQHICKSIFKTLINGNYSIGVDIDKYQSALEQALYRVNFAMGTGFYMLPSNLKLNIEKTEGHYNKIFIRNIEVYHQKF